MHPQEINEALPIASPSPASAYTVEYQKLHVIAYNEDLHSRSCNYWYAVQTSFMAHTAFTTKEGLMRWMSERGLELEQDLPAERGMWALVGIKGSYLSSSWLSYDAFFALEPDPGVIRTKVMSNGDYTLGLITTEESGLRNVNYLNPNCRHRPIFDYSASRLEMA